MTGKLPLLDDHALFAWAGLALAAAYLALVARFAPTDTEFVVLLALLIVSTLLAARVHLREGFLQDAQAKMQEDLKSVTASFWRLAAIPRMARGALNDGLEYVVVSVASNNTTNANKKGKQEDAMVEAKRTGMITISHRMYKDEMPEQAYKAMAAEYAKAQFLLCSLRSADRPLHKAIIKRILDREAFDKVKAQEQEQQGEGAPPEEPPAAS